MLFLLFQYCLSYTLPQKIDHHDIYPGTFNQTFYLNRTFYLDDKPSIIVYIGGLHKLSPKTLELNSLLKIAEQSNSVLFALEHRYFGKSEVFSNLSIENLSFLTIEQTIDDIGNFTNYVKQEWCHKSTKCRLALVGEDYGGTIAVWAKRQFPDLIDSVWAISSPLYATNQFSGVDSFHSNLFGQFSRTCTSITNRGLTEIGDILTSDNQTAIDELYSQFKETNESIPIKENFLYALTKIVYQLIDLYVQGDISPLLAFCHDISFENFRQKLQEAFLKNFSTPLSELDPTWPKDETNSTMRNQRLETYLMCNELGWVSVAQTGAIQYKIMPTILNNTYSNEKICNELFGIKFASRDYFNLHHGGKSPRVSSVIYTNSLNHNYSNIMYSEPTDEENEIFYFPYSDFSNSPIDYQGVDSPELITARQSTIQMMTEWLSMYSNCNHGVARLHKCVCNKGYSGTLCNLRTMRNEYTSMTTAAVTIPTIVMFLIGVMAWCLFIESTKETKQVC